MTHHDTCPRCGNRVSTSSGLLYQCGGCTAFWLSEKSYVGECEAVKKETYLEHGLPADLEDLVTMVKVDALTELHGYLKITAETVKKQYEDLASATEQSILIKRVEKETLETVVEWLEGYVEARKPKKEGDDDA